MIERTRAPMLRIRTCLAIGSSIRAISAAAMLLGANHALAQATTTVPDPADSTSSAANPNEAGSADRQKSDNAAASGDATPAQNEAAAQAAGQAAADAGATTAQQDIVVTGFRRALETAVAEKKNRDQVVESVSAEDIGKLPDSSIAESIARLPGLTSQRIQGRSEFISIRGFSPDFSTTLLNGREQTSTGDNRAVEFDQYPSEVINQVLVYKTPMAAIIGQGLAGTVDLRTIRPLEYGKRIISIGARGVDADLGKLNADSDRYGYRVNGTYVDQFADGKIGVSLAVAYNHEPYQTQEFNAWGYGSIGNCDARYSTLAATGAVDCGPGQPAATRYATPKPDYADAIGKSIIGGSKSYVTSTVLKRLGATGSVEIKPTHNFTSTFDGFYSDFKDDSIKRGIELPLGFGPNSSALQPGYTVTGDQITQGTFSNVEDVIRNDIFQRHAKLYAFGWNGQYKGDDGWNVTGDVSYSRTKRHELVVESYSGTGYGAGNGATDSIGFDSTSKGSVYTHQLDYSDPSRIFLTDPLGWGGSTIQSGYYNNRKVDDRIWQYRGEVEKELQNSFLSSIQFGLNYTNHDKSLTPDEAFLQLADGSLQAAIPSQFLENPPTSLNYLGLGQIVSYQPLKLLANGVYRLLPNTVPEVAAKAYGVHEDLMTIYLQGNIKQSIGASELTGNIGVQAINTSQHSNGFYVDKSVNTAGTLVAIRQGDDYWDVLPSINLSLRLPSDFVIRVAGAREVMRPRMDDMRLGLNYGVDLTSRPTGPFLSGSSGDPRLRPFRANAADLTFEKYFGTKGYLAAQFFYKGFDTFVVDQNLPGQPYDYSGLPLPQGYQNTNPAAPGYLSQDGITDGLLFQPYNVSGGKLYGVELAGTISFGDFVKFLDGFGATGGGSYTKSKIHQYPGAKASDLPGYSRWVANGTLYFEKWGFSARGSVRYRSTFLGEVSGYAANRVQRRAEPETIVDGQIGYDFSKVSHGVLAGLSLYLQGENLTNEPFATQNPGEPLQVIDYQRYGRRFLGGFTYKF